MSDVEVSRPSVLVTRNVGNPITNGPTVMWAVGDDLDSIVEALRGKGVTFEHYDDLPDTTRAGDVHQIGDLKGVWFKDPDGNILSVVNR